MKFHCVFLIILLCVLTTTVERAHSDETQDETYPRPGNGVAPYEADVDDDINEGDGEEGFEETDEENNENEEGKTNVTGNELRKIVFPTSNVETVSSGERCSSTANRPPLSGAGGKPSRIDALLKVEDSKYFFEGSTVYVLSGSGLETKWICDIFPRGPTKVTGALYNEMTRQFLLIDSREVYAFVIENDETKLVENFPKHFEVSAPVTGAIYLDSKQFFIVEGGLCGFYYENWNRFIEEKPVEITTYFGLMPNNVVGGYRTGETYVSDMTYGIYDLFTRDEVWSWSRYPNSANITCSIQEYFN